MRGLVLLPFLFATSSAFAGKPDLLVTDIEIVNDKGPTWEILVRVSNEGDAPAQDFWVDLFVDLAQPAEVGDFSQHAEWYNDVLGVGQKRAFFFKVPPNPASWWDAVVDSDHIVYESNEGNNTRRLFLQ